MLSSGHKKEMLVLMFVSSIITVAKEEEALKDDDIVNYDNRDYKLNKRIDRRLEKLKSDIDKYLADNGNADFAKWIKSKNATSTIKALEKANASKINLELLALWIMYVNFTESGNRLHESLSDFKNHDYIKDIDLFDKTKVGYTNDKMFDLAYDIVGALKI